jgi:hypothetical protein
MAITFVGSATGSAINGLNVTVDLSGIAMQEGDVAVLVAGNLGILPTEPGASGWTVSYGDTTARIVAYKLMGATPDASVTCTGPGTTTSAATAVVEVFRGVDAAILDADITTADDSSTNPDSPAITTVTDGAIVISAVTGTVSDTSVTAPSGYNNGVSINASDTVSSTSAMAWQEQATAGVENPPSWTTFSFSSWASFSVALRPSGAASTTGAGEADGHATAEGGGGRINNLVGAADGHATSLGEGSRLVAGGGDGTAVGHSTTSGIGAPFFSAPGLADGHATAEAESQEASSSADGLAVGTSTASGIFAVRRPKVRAINASIISGRGKLRVTHTGLPNESL